jgi:hypothetical protein
MSSKATTFAHPKTETFFERHAWKVFFIVSLFIALIGLPDLLAGGSFYQRGDMSLLRGISGMTWEQLKSTSPNAVDMIDFKVRMGGLEYLFLGFFSMAIVLTGFRRGEQWAWYTMWLFPIFMALHTLIIFNAFKHPEAGTPEPLGSGLFMFILTTLILVLSYRKFFPK